MITVLVRASAQGPGIPVVQICQTFPKKGSDAAVLLPERL
ncbi:hypothetical protein SNOG_03487 [Parastagonospora nodorum SN15]|uniref:Uncharacterized protein n=1 Tax=Phaeosphaeria nodorum (strain SN15 / ATCC MYA-4574 / FGSC 10173) TaxID=321614 RepID=Q0UXM7_PHANO|nr:hypothetical protein SNOG_03487 [Parastagonospora nodorum SN15]EAT88692.1 hypothetical protein SNOG_03487 [Parastagonospora nodorum SN15]